MPAEGGGELVTWEPTGTERSFTKMFTSNLSFKLCGIISVSISGSNTDTTIPCSFSNVSLMSFSLIWRFNHSQIILNQTRGSVSPQVSEEWRQQVKGVSESGSLALQGLSPNQEGIYTCELSTDEETYVTNTYLRTEKSHGTVARQHNTTARSILHNAS